MPRRERCRAPAGRRPGLLGRLGTRDGAVAARQGRPGLGAGVPRRPSRHPSHVLESRAARPWPAGDLKPAAAAVVKFLLWAGIGGEGPAIQSVPKSDSDKQQTVQVQVPRSWRWAEFSARCRSAARVKPEDLFEFHRHREFHGPVSAFGVESAARPAAGPQSLGSARTPGSESESRCTD